MTDPARLRAEADRLVKGGQGICNTIDMLRAAAECIETLRLDLLDMEVRAVRAEGYAEGLCSRTAAGEGAGKP